jgi:hypothetical protein
MNLFPHKPNHKPCHLASKSPTSSGVDLGEACAARLLQAHNIGIDRVFSINCLQKVNAAHNADGENGIVKGSGDDSALKPPKHLDGLRPYRKITAAAGA